MNARRWLILLAMISSVNSFAQMPSQGKYYAFRLGPHEDLKKSIVKFVADHQLKAVAIVSCVGSLEQYTIRFANQPNGTVGSGYFEIVSLTGTVDAHTSHIHMSVADQAGKTIGGHLLDGNLVYTTAEIVIVELVDYEFKREKDSTYGYQELVIKKRSP